MPSFDVVSEIDMHELDNAIDQANREVGNRYDFKGSDAKFEYAENVISMETGTEFQLQQMLDVFYNKASKRGIDLESFEVGEAEERGKRAYQKDYRQTRYRQGNWQEDCQKDKRRKNESSGLYPGGAGACYRQET